VRGKIKAVKRSVMLALVIKHEVTHVIDRDGASSTDIVQFAGVVFLTDASYITLGPKDRYLSNLKSQCTALCCDFQ
jgi:hypothetical protein